MQQAKVPLVTPASCTRVPVQVLASLLPIELLSTYLKKWKGMAQALCVPAIHMEGRDGVLDACFSLPHFYLLNRALKESGVGRLVFNRNKDRCYKYYSDSKMSIILIFFVVLFVLAITN